MHTITLSLFGEASNADEIDKVINRFFYDYMEDASTPPVGFSSIPVCSKKGEYILECVFEVRSFAHYRGLVEDLTFFLELERSMRDFVDNYFLSPTVEDLTENKNLNR